MRQTKEILRQKWLLERSHREIARSVGASLGAVTGAIQRAERAGLDWPTVEATPPTELESRLYPSIQISAKTPPDPVWIHTELKRPGVTLQLLHLEYLERYPDGFRYSRFCDLYRAWLRRRRVAMRQVHKAGEKLFLDYAGKKPSIVDPTTGEVIEVELFVAVLGASNYTYAEATRTQRVEDWIASHVRALAFLGGVPEVFVPDQLRSAVARPCRYEPGVQRTYAELAEHYGVAVIPARPAKPRDKAKVEAGVLVAERWILARLRHQTFFSLDALNERIRELLDELNHRTMRAYQASRAELFERLDRPALHALPSAPFAFGTWERATVNIDYHVEIERHYYSVPFTLAGEKTDVRVSATTVEVFHRGHRVTAHARSFEAGKHTTLPEHMPASHRAHAEWSPSRFLRWGRKIGPATAELIDAILRERRHPEQGYRSCLGILRLAKRYGAERLEAACVRAVAVRARSYRHVDEILKHGLDRLAPIAPELPLETQSALPRHENVRGAAYYTQGEIEC